jgi:lysophospholipase L1-like esterase
VGALSTDFQLDWKLLAKTGHKAREVLARLEQAEPEVFDVVLTSIGVNDVTGGTGLLQWQDEQRRLIKLLKVKFQAQHIFLSSLPPMEHFTALPFPLRSYLGMRARRFSVALAKIAAADPHCSMIDVNFPFDPSYLAADGFHPGEPGYALWAERSALAIRARVSFPVAATGY